MFLNLKHVTLKIFSLSQRNENPRILKIILGRCKVIYPNYGSFNSTSRVGIVPLNDAEHVVSSCQFSHSERLGQPQVDGQEPAGDGTGL